MTWPKERPGEAMMPGHSGVARRRTAGASFWLQLVLVGTMAGAMQLSVNGQLVTNQTTPGGRWSVKSLLQPGDNTISLRLDTTLLNKMAEWTFPPHGGAYFSFMVMLAGRHLIPAPSGLIGPVQLIPAGVAKVN